MLCQGNPRVVVSLALGLILVWSIRLFHVPDTISTLFYEYTGHSKLKDDIAFIRQAMDVEFPAAIDYKPIQEICSRSEFRSGLVFTCEEQHGGIGMVRNQILKCVRYAISGGGALVVPTMALRNATDITDIETSNEVPLDYLIDRKTFVTHLTKGCPGMRVYDRIEDFYSYQSRVSLDLVGDQFEPKHPREGLRHPREWRRNFDEWLQEQSVQIRTDKPVHVRMGQAFLEYPIRDDGKAFANEFGKIISFRNDTRALAAKVLFELKEKFKLRIDPGKAINPDAYYGAHLRLEKDAVSAWQPEEWRFSRMDDQFGEQFRKLEESGLNLVYVASGNQTVVDIFRQRLNERLRASKGFEAKNITVVTKYDLLRGVDRLRLDKLTFDQHALVDFLMLFKASSFMGVAHSSFPWNVALRRHELSKYEAYGNEGSDLLKDEYSEIMGMEADYPYVDPFVYGIWP
ncbi:hypothetical protein C8034_v010891 [Colletotrichum sidae]|uniref:Alternative oxidase n=1 Tax=Colletotrichum sidae TaxID=1347389 RepID=A0A4R8T105_9PEZI|nr:hypothetical protein C8034_v010891 [Colletotrichum sidae]